MILLYALLIPFATVTTNLLGKDLEPTFFDINVDRDHPEKIYKAFEEFIVKYKRNYKDDNERKFRFNNFVKTYNKVDELNANSQKSGYNTKYGINKFADWSSSEFRGTLSHFPPPNNTNIPHLKINPFFRPTDNTTRKREKRDIYRYPEEFDLRDVEFDGNRIVGEIKDQGNCSCCWGFGVTALMETVNAVHKKRFTELSDEEICDCATEGSPGCFGGTLEMGVRYVQRYGQSAAEEYPWELGRANYSRRCKLRKTKRVILPRKVHFVQINSGNAEMEIKHVLVNWKVPVAVYYKVGTQLDKYKDGTIEIDDCRDAEHYHSGVIIGYGTDSDKPGKPTDFWTIKNSWGSFGEDGYFRVIRGVDWCGMESNPITGDMNGHVS